MSGQISRRHVLAGGAGALAFSTMGARAQVPKGEPIKIGAMVPLTGTLAALTFDTRAGIEIAVAQINADGGVLGRPLELIVRDDKGNANDAVAAARELLGNGVRFLLGGTLTSTTLAVIPAVKEAGALFTSVASTTMRLGHEDFNRNLFHYQPHSYISMHSEAKVMAGKYPNVTKWITIGPDVEFGHISWSTFGSGLREFYPKIAGKPVTLLEPVWTKYGASDFKAAVSAIMDSGAEGLHISLVGADAITFLTQARTLGLFEKIKVCADLGADVSTARSLRKNTPNNYWTTTLWYPQAPNATALSKRCYDDFKARYKDKDDPVGLVAGGYGATRAYVDAMRKTNSTDPNAVITAMEDMKFETPGGVAYYRKEDHQCVAPMGVIRMGPTDPGQQPVLEYVTVDTAEVIEPASPGTAFPLPEPVPG